MSFNEISVDDLNEFREMVKSRNELDSEIFDWIHDSRWVLWGKYRVSVFDRGFKLQKMCFDGGLIIDTKELLGVEEYTGAKLNSIKNYVYEFVWV